MAEAKLMEKIAKMFEDIAEEDSAAPDVERVFQKMIDPPYRGKVLYGHLSNMSPSDFQPRTPRADLIRFFRSHPDKFAIFEGDDSRVAMFGVRVPKARLCSKRNGELGACEDVGCLRFHVCKRYIAGNCTAAKCRGDHHFQSEHSRRLLKEFDLESFKDADLLTILRQSHLQICNIYDRKGSCDHDDRCTRIHVCSDYVNGLCSEPCPKNLTHGFETTHSQRLLEVYDLRGLSLEDQLDELLICKTFAQKSNEKQLQMNDLRRLIAKGASAFHGKDDEGTSDDDDDDDDCDLSHIRTLNPGDKDSKLAEVKASDHDNSAHSHPSKDRWNPQKSAKWDMEIFGEWKQLGDIRNKRLEMAYCDPEQDTIQIALPDVDECTLYDTLIHVNLNSMTATLPGGGEKLNLRRVSKGNDTWLWYYETDEKSWTPYHMDDQDLLESGFLVKEKRVFVGKGEIYRVNFSDLTQRNRETRKERRIRRRPILVDH